MVKVKDDLVQQIIEQLQDIQYGALLITVHNDEITQLDVTRKQRFDRSSRNKANQKSTLKHII
ncbi:MAG: YezD family protein [Lysinibacillus sp.]